MTPAMIGSMLAAEPPTYSMSQQQAPYGRSTDHLYAAATAASSAYATQAPPPPPPSYMASRYAMDRAGGSTAPRYPTYVNRLV